MIVQRSKFGASDPTDPEAGKSPDAQKAPGEADGDADRDPPPTDADVDRQIRKGAPPQSQQMPDRLMKTVGLQKQDVTGLAPISPPTTPIAFRSRKGLRDLPHVTLSEPLLVLRPSQTGDTTCAR
jgi:hypothetical protein